MNFMDKLENRFGDEVLLHYGVKGMKWKDQKDKPKTEPTDFEKRLEAARDKHRTDAKRDQAQTLKGMSITGKSKTAKKVYKLKTDIKAKVFDTKIKVSDASRARRVVEMEKRKKRINGKMNKLFKDRKIKHSFDNIMNSTAPEVLIHSELQIRHHGVKGMRWGVRNSRRSSSNSVTTSKKDKPTKPANLKNPVNRLKAEIASAKREASWSKKATANMSNRDLKRLSKRIQLENDLKGLVGKKEYLVRGDVSTKDLKARVDRLQLQKNLRLQSNIANKSNRDRADAVVKSVSNITVDMITKKSPNLNAAIRKEMTNVTVSKISKKTKIPKDILDAAVKSVQGEYKTAKAEAQAKAPPKTEKTKTTKSKTTTSKTIKSNNKTYTGKVYKSVDDLNKRKRP